MRDLLDLIIYKKDSDQRSLRKDFEMIPEEYDLTEPAAKTTIISVPYRSDPIDLTEMYGNVAFDQRTLTIKVIVSGDLKSWNAKLSKLANFAQGQLLHIIDNSSPDYYFLGRLNITPNKPSRYIGHATLTFTVNPYKYSLISTTEPWKWDPFNFYTGVIRYYKDLEVEGSLEMTIIGDSKPTEPTIIVSSDMTMEFDGREYELAQGSNNIPGFSIVEGEHTAIFTGNGTVTIEFRGGTL